MTNLRLLQAKQKPELQDVVRLDQTFYPDTYDLGLSWYREVARKAPLAFWLLKVNRQAVGSSLQYPLQPEAWQALSEGVWEKKTWGQRLYRPSFLHSIGIWQDWVCGLNTGPRDGGRPFGSQFVVDCSWGAG